jgi:hypothetical protein
MDQTALGAVVGWCDGYQRGYIRGWAWYPRRPHETVTIEILVDGQVVAEAAACVARPDLKTAGIGQGRHAFAIPFIIPPDAPHEVHVSVRAKDGPVLGNGDFNIEVTPESRAMLERRNSIDYLEAIFGSFDSDAPPARSLPPADPPPQQHFILYSAVRGADIAEKLGAADYSYFFVMRGFREVLRRIGIVHVVRDPADVDLIYRACRERQQECTFLSFAPPHATICGLACPTIPVIAWEFGTIPSDVWDDEPRHDWRRVLRETGRAIAISGFAARVIGQAMGPAFPVRGIPTPVWDRLAGMRGRLSQTPPHSSPPIAIEGFVWDSRTADIWLGMPLPPIPVMAARKKIERLPMRDCGMMLAEASATSRVLDQVVADKAAEDRENPRLPRGVARVAVTWYRDAVKGALPRPAARAVSVAGRLAWRTSAALRGLPTSARAAAPDAASAISVSVAEAVAEHAVPLPSSVTRKWTAPTDLVPMPEPELAIFDPDPWPPPAPAQPDAVPAVTLDGVVFTTVLAPKDGRKNWQDILSAFVLAFQDTRDATLVFKMIGADPAFWWWEFHDLVTRLPAYACRVVVLHGYLDDQAYEQLIDATHFVTNASLAEGQCLPLVEFMSGGRPAVAPNHTAMADYISPANAIIVKGDLEYCAWPHDPRNNLGTTRYRMDWSSLKDAFCQAYAIAKTDPARYRAMAQAAAAAMQAYCGDESVSAALKEILYLRSAATPHLEEAAA